MRHGWAKERARSSFGRHGEQKTVINFTVCLIVRSAYRPDASCLRSEEYPFAKNSLVTVRCPHIITNASDTSNASSALRQASNKLPVITEFISRNTPPRLGNLEIVADEDGVAEKIEQGGLKAASALAVLSNVQFSETPTTAGPSVSS